VKEKKEQILVVDDEPRNLQLLGNLLRQENYGVRFASDGEKAVQGCREKPCDLILLDVMMPGLDGFAVCRTLKEDPKTRHIPIIFITAKNQPDQIVQGFEAGGVDYITKPFAGQELLARVRTHLELKRTRSELDKTVRELRGANEELRQINDSQRRFFSMIAHDLRSPFNGLRMFPQLLATRFDTMKREEIIKIAQDVEDQVDHVHRFLEELLEWCHYESGQLQVQRGAVPLHDCVEAVLAVARSAAYAKDVELRNDVPPELRAQGDRRMICTILQNLISNAIKFSRRESQVVIRAKSLPAPDAPDTRAAAGPGCGAAVDLSVKDSGVGMPASVRDSLFELGKRTTTRGTEDERGTGFGLQLTKQFVDLHQGKLVVESEVGCGTEIHVILPRS
jgi:signal transduction histidine kinase